MAILESCKSWFRQVLLIDDMKINYVLSHVDHRPWPLPGGPWVMTQRWLDLLFAHWPIPVDVMRSLIPPQLDLDTFDGEAWVGVVPFRMENVRPRWVPPVPWLSAFPELNVRTYVRMCAPEGPPPLGAPLGAANPKPGVYFFSLDAANPVAVTLARSLFKLPYFYAQMRLLDDGKTIYYQSHRTHRGAGRPLGRPLGAADFVGSYTPMGEVFRAAAGSLEQWLTERYSLYTVDRPGNVYISEIHHLPWPLQAAAAEFQVNTMAAASGIVLPATQPLLHFARRLDVAVWPLRRVQ
jgi:uncharacterized protein YqjF (DUF2071 family)